MVWPTQNLSLSKNRSQCFFSLLYTLPAIAKFKNDSDLFDELWKEEVAARVHALNQTAVKVVML